MEDEDPALMRGIVKATLYKRGTFKAAKDAWMAVLASEDVLVIAEREAQIEAYMDLARPIYQLLLSTSSVSPGLEQRAPRSLDS